MQYKVFGCKVNKYYTDRWLNSDYLSDKTGTFVASCVVTDSAKRKWVRFVKKEVENISENGKIYISGCGAFKDGKAQNNFFNIYPDLAPFKDKVEVLDEAPAEDSEKQSLREDEKKEMHQDFVKSENKTKPKIDLSKLRAAQQTQIYTRKYLLIQG
jgi:tRNA A37 methylthiotransferase MiaB